MAQSAKYKSLSLISQTTAKPQLVVSLLKVLVLLAVMFTLYLSKLIILPILIAGLLALFASPLVRGLMAVKIPKQAASVIVVVGIVSAMIFLAASLTEPAARWLQSAPIIVDRLLFELRYFAEPFGFVAPSGPPAAGGSIEQAVDSTVLSVATVLAHSTIILLAQLAVIIILTYFFLSYGEDLMRSVVKARSSFADKKVTVVVFQAIRDDVSRYILVISCINICLGLATAGALTLVGVEDVLLWGALATMLNFAPYVGPLTLALILTAVGFTEGQTLLAMLIAPGVYLCLNLVESQFVTPTVLGNRFNINPLLVVLWMLVWGWIWGAAGMLLAIPILMCFKIMALHMDIIGPWVEVLNGQRHEAHEPVQAPEAGEPPACKSLHAVENPTS